MPVNHKDAPKGYIAVQSNPHLGCKTCVFDINQSCHMPKVILNPAEWTLCSTARADGTSVIFKLETSHDLQPQ